LTEETINHTVRTINWTSDNRKDKCSRRGKERLRHKILYWFTLPQGLRPVLCQLAKSSTKKDHQDQFYTIHSTCNPQATTALSSK